MYAIQKIETLKVRCNLGGRYIYMQLGGGGGAWQIGVICGSKNRWEAATRQYWVYSSEKLWCDVCGGRVLAMLL